jgi:protein TonB
MEQPFHTIRIQSPRFTPQRAVGLLAALALQAGFVYMLVSGLAASLIQKLPEDIKVAVEQQKLPDKIPPPPPPPLQQPPPPFMPPPDIVIQADAPATTAIQASTVKPPAGITAPFSIGRAHACGDQYFPASAKRMNHEGTTIITFTIGVDGYPKNITVKESSGFEELDQAAIPCATRWHYNPAMQNGQPVEVQQTAKVVWQIQK